MDAVSVRQVQRGIGQVDPLQVLADGLGYEYRFIAAGKDDGQTQRGQAVLTRLIAAESGPDQPGLNYLRLDDGATPWRSTPMPVQVRRSCRRWSRVRGWAPRQCCSAVAGESAKAAGFDPARVALEADASYFSDGFQAPAVRRSRWRQHPARDPADPGLCPRQARRKAMDGHRPQRRCARAAAEGDDRG